MTSRDFCYWLQGFLEIGSPKELTKEQLVVIQKHLAMVFKQKIDPSHTPSKGLQAELTKIHSGKDPLIRC